MTRRVRTPRPFVRVAHFPDGTREHYERLAVEIGNVAVPPARLAFLAGPTAGGWQVVQVWRTQEELDAFNEAVLLPALARLGDRGFPRRPEVHDFLAEDAQVTISGPVRSDGDQCGLAAPDDRKGSALRLS